MTDPFGRLAILPAELRLRIYKEVFRSEDKEALIKKGWLYRSEATKSTSLELKIGSLTQLKDLRKVELPSILQVSSSVFDEGVLEWLKMRTIDGSRQAQLQFFEILQQMHSLQVIPSTTVIIAISKARYDVHSSLSARLSGR